MHKRSWIAGDMRLDDGGVLLGVSRIDKIRDAYI